MLLDNQRLWPRASGLVEKEALKNEYGTRNFEYRSEVFCQFQKKHRSRFANMTTHAKSELILRHSMFGILRFAFQFLEVSY